MKVLDRYIIRELFVPIFFCSLSLIVLILVADLFDNLSDFIRYNTPLAIVGRYYLSLVPYAFVQTISWATWLGCLFLLVNFGLHNELIAMKVAGLKIASIVRPVLFFGFLIGILTFIINDRILPISHRATQELSDIYILNNAEETEGKVIRNVTFHSGNNHLYYFRKLLMRTGEAQDIVLLWLDKTTHKTYQKITSQNAVYKNGAWEFSTVTEHQIDSRGRILGEPRNYVTKVCPEINATPQDLANASRESMLLTYREMKEAMQKLKETGVDIRSELVNLHYRLAAPWQGLIMILITIPLLGSTHNRRGIGSAVLLCIGFIFAYQLTSAISVALGKSGALFPFLSAWGGNILFAVAGLLNLDRANF